MGVIKTFSGLARASVKTHNGLALASVKTWNGMDAVESAPPTVLDLMTFTGVPAGGSTYWGGTIGSKFYVAADCTCVNLQWWKTAGSSQVHRIYLWGPAGELGWVDIDMSDSAFASEAMAKVNLASPVQLYAGIEYAVGGQQVVGGDPSKEPQNSSASNNLVSAAGVYANGLQRPWQHGGGQAFGPCGIGFTIP